MWYIIGGIVLFLVLVLGVWCEQTIKSDDKDTRGFEKWYPLLDTYGRGELTDALRDLHKTDVEYPVRYLCIRLHAPGKGDNGRASFGYVRRDSNVALGVPEKGDDSLDKRSTWRMVVSRSTIWDGLDRLKAEMEKEGSWNPKGEEKQEKPKEYKCSVCGATHGTEDGAKLCERSHDVQSGLLHWHKKLNVVRIELCVYKGEVENKTIEWYYTSPENLAARPLMQPKTRDDTIRPNLKHINIYCKPENIELAARKIEQFFQLHFKSPFVKLLYFPEASGGEWLELDALKALPDDEAFNSPVQLQNPLEYHMYCSMAALQEGRKQFYDYVYAELRKKASDGVEQVNKLNAEYRRIKEEKGDEDSKTN